MKKKIVAIVLCIAMLAIAIVGGTMAYFTDNDAAQNVMTTGKVDISQLEQQRDDSGNLVDFKQNKPLMPMVDARKDGEAVVVGDYFSANMRNVVDKIITVKNEAKDDAINQDAYVRTIIAFETNTEYEAGTANVLRDGKAIFDTYIGTLGDFELLSRDTVKINGVEYVLAVKVYENALAPQKVSEPSLKQIFLSPNANNEVEVLFGSEYTILAVSQATQTAGFEPVKDGDGNVIKTASAVALDAAFGDLETIDEATLIEWLSAAQDG